MRVKICRVFKEDKELKHRSGLLRFFKTKKNRVDK